MKKLMKKITAVVLMAALIAGVMPLTGLAGVLKLAPVTVEAADTDPFDTSSLTVKKSNNYKGAKWTLYSNWLLWVEDDTSGETEYDYAITNGTYDVTDILEDPDFRWDAEDVKYIYWDITAPKSCDFSECSNLVGIAFGDTFKRTSGNLKSLYGMFYVCRKLNSVDMSGIDTSNVTDMSRMFGYCENLVNLNLSGLNTSNVTNMYAMFINCNRLKALDVSGFDTSNVKYMDSMFYGCYKVSVIDVSNFDTSNVTNMNSMFGSCESVTSLDVSKFDTTNVTNMNSMFQGCYGVTGLDVSKFDTSNVTDMGGMFGSCRTLTSLDVSNFDTAKVTNMRNMFSGCSSLTSLDVSNFDTSEVTNMYAMFRSCSSLTDLDVCNFDTAKVTDMDYMFQLCSSLTDLDLSNFDMSKVTDSKCMIWTCTKLHLLQTPLNYTSDTVSRHLNEGWYKLTNNTVDKSVEYVDVPAGMTTSVTLVRELTHRCNDVTNGVGTCHMCGVSVLYGDCDDDSVVDVKDAVRLKKYLAGDDTFYINLGAANVNVDYEITVEDAVKLVKHLAGMDVTLGVME